MGFGGSFAWTAGRQTGWQQATKAGKNGEGVGNEQSPSRSVLDDDGTACGAVMDTSLGALAHGDRAPHPGPGVKAEAPINQPAEGGFSWGDQPTDSREEERMRQIVYRPPPPPAGFSMSHPS